MFFVLLLFATFKFLGRKFDVFFFRIMYLFQYAILIVYLRLCQNLNLVIVIDAKFPSVATKRTKNKAYFTEKLYSRLPATH